MSFALVILGPTASGKSALSLSLARIFDIEIISLDSALIYRGMDIGTAKPSKEELAICPHHLIDICDPKESYSAASFREDCINLVEQIQSRGRIPVICGGTMLYYKALVDGLSPLPATDEAVRKRVSNLAQEKGWPYIHQMLKDIDTVSYEKLSCNDKQRLSRALEVYYMTGRAISSFYTQKVDKCPFERLEFALLPQNNDRTELRAMIRTRFMAMLEQGFVDEVRALKSRGDLHSNLPSMRSVGYRQVLEYLDGQYDYTTMIEKAVVATAHLAKHQMTWLNGSLSYDRHKLIIGCKDNLSIVQKALEAKLHGN